MSPLLDDLALYVKEHIDIATFCSRPISGFVYIKLLTNKIHPFFTCFIVTSF